MRPGIPKEQKKQEGEFLAAAIRERQKADPSITYESLALEYGGTQGLVSQWTGGNTSIPDKALMWLGGRLGFDPFKLRPSLSDYFHMPLKYQSRRADLIKVLSALSRCDDAKYATAIGVLGALFPDAGLLPE